MTDALQQRRDALVRANTVRLARVAVKNEIRAGRATIADVIDKECVAVFRAGQVLAALELWIASPDGARQPSPADLYQLIAQPRAADGATNQPQDVRRDQQPAVLTLVAGMVDRGEKVCACVPASATLVQDSRDVLWCPACGGIELGQADQAREHVAPQEPAVDVPLHDLSAIVRLRRVRDGRAAA